MISTLLNLPSILSKKYAVNLVNGDLRITKEKFEFPLVRANIQINDVPYWGIDENNIAYIRVSRFSKNTAKNLTPN